MSSHGPIYETTFYVDADRIAEFDNWLGQHARDARLLPVVEDCRIFAIADDADGRHGRTCQFALTDDDIATAFVEGFGTDVEAEAEAAFSVLFSSRLLREDTAVDVAPGENPDCLNCGTRLRGQYCGNCGQRARGRLISLWELITDAFGDLFELDSRLWKTLVPLMLKPGQLTSDYLSGKRARFMPPFRSCLVLSLLFFLVAFFDPVGDLEFDAAGEASPAETEQGGEQNCEVTDADIEGIPEFLRGILNKQRLTHICERLSKEPKQLFENLLDNVPAALIVLLPIMALVLKMLYPLSRHYYVEHLLFFIHFHAFFFVLLTLQILFSRLGSLLLIPDPIVVLAIVATSFYVPIYLFIAMRRVYGQAFFLRSVKFLALGAAYLAGFSLTMLGALVVAALTI